MRRLRTINEAVRYLKQQDPETSMTPYFIRRFIIEGQVPTIMAGKKYLVDLDCLLAHLDQQLESPTVPESPVRGVIRQIPQRIRT
jgi:LPS sulfotransferase NodH